MNALHVDLRGRVAVVTGASRGIGRRIAVDLAECGATVAACARTPPDFSTTADPPLPTENRLVRSYALDIGREDCVRTVFDAVDTELGPPDILINNAGTGHFGPTLDFPAEKLDETLRVNIRGTFLCCQTALASMQERGHGTIINVSSVVGFKGYAEQAAYTASKHAIMGLTKSLANEFHRSGIRISAVLPGGVDTGMVGQSRPDLDRSELMQPEDISSTVLYLLALPERAMVDQIYIRRSASSPF